jgi:sigma-B regulation protein RsbU (phosphoserine phosphatase)
MIIGLFVGLVIGLAAVWLVDLRLRKRLKNAEEAQWLLREEKQLVVEFMHRMVEAVGENQNLESLYQRIVHASVRSTGAMAACLYAYDGKGSLRGAAVEGLFPPQRPLPRQFFSTRMTRAEFIGNILKGESFQVGEGLVGSVAKSRQALLVADAVNDPRVLKHDDPALEIRSLIIAPIIFRGDLLGVLAVANPGDGFSFTETDFSLVESLAEQAGLAINNNRMLSLQLEKNRLDLDIELASSIQGLLLPDAFPATDKLDIATAYRPAQKIGGDLYDVFALTEDRIGLAVADVSGKGISGSILMATCQTHLRHFARNETSPAAALCALNQALQHVMRTDMFITITYAIIDLPNNRITLARAGHETPILLRNAQGGRFEVEQAECEGMALGMVPADLFDEAICDCELGFNRGDALVLFTDGVTETVNPHGTEFSTSRLMDALAQDSQLSAQTMVTNVMDRLDRFGAGNGQTDDITLLVAKQL